MAKKKAIKKVAKKANTKKASAKDSRSEGDLTAMRELFIFNYIENGFKNGRQAALDAGYSAKSAHVEASRLLTNDKVQKKIAEKKIELEAELDTALKISTTQVLAKWAKIGLKVSDASHRDQLKATELIARYMGMFNEAGKGDNKSSGPNADQGVQDILTNMQRTKEKRSGRLGSKTKKRGNK